MRLEKGGEQAKAENGLYDSCWGAISGDSERVFVVFGHARLKL
jgi:hypothetical protein